jgi:hypothetical protein
MYQLAHNAHQKREATWNVEPNPYLKGKCHEGETWPNLMRNARLPCNLVSDSKNGKGENAIGETVDMQESSCATNLAS